MNGILRFFIVASLLAAGIPASAGPVQILKRQSSNLTGLPPADTAGLTTQSIWASAAPSVPMASATTMTTIPSSTSCMGTAVSAPPAVSMIGSFMLENPDFRTRSFTVPTETATPTCNVLKCSLTYTEDRPIYGNSISLPGYSNPSSESTIASTSIVPPGSTETNISRSADVFATSGGARSTI